MAADSVLTGIKNGSANAANEVIGPSYDYASHIPGPGSLGVGSGGSFGQLFTNINAIRDYMKVMISGDPPLGNAFYVNTGASCVAPNGSTQTRYNYINNISSGKALVPSGMKDMSFISSNVNGLIPGVAGDIVGLNPKYLFSALTAEGVPACQCYKCPVTSGSPFRFLSPDLSPDFDSALCKVADITECTGKSKESFGNKSGMSALPTILAAIGLGLLTFSGK